MIRTALDAHTVVRLNRHAETVLSSEFQTAFHLFYVNFRFLLCLANLMRDLAFTIQHQAVLPVYNLLLIHAHALHLLLLCKT
jgi:hypothetical protein